MAVGTYLGHSLKVGEPSVEALETLGLLVVDVNEPPLQMLRADLQLLERGRSVARSSRVRNGHLAQVRDRG